MWAGSEIKVLKPIRVGDKVIKQSTVADIQVKEGRTGLLCFVTAEYNFLVNDEVTINEKHNIVYRDISKSGGGSGYSKDIPEKADLSEKFLCIQLYYLDIPQLDLLGIEFIMIIHTQLMKKITLA